MGARLADSLDQPVWRQYLRQDLRRLAGLIIKVERHPAAAMPGEEAADRRVILRPVADEDRDVICLERLRHLRSEEHTSELQSLMRNSYAVFCLKKKNITNNQHTLHHAHKHALLT